MFNGYILFPSIVSYFHDQPQARWWYTQERIARGDENSIYMYSTLHAWLYCCRTVPQNTSQWSVFDPVWSHTIVLIRSWTCLVFVRYLLATGLPSITKTINLENQNLEEHNVIKARLLRGTAILHKHALTFNIRSLKQINYKTYVIVACFVNDAEVPSTENYT